ncbi:MAG TPA: efflux RND transporter periplasmic adaptor subunit [Burkholderiales bacterium]|nr:efflux RND transporter periplasmic adaptor subunit [Burkholderiales bacterium]
MKAARLLLALLIGLAACGERDAGKMAAPPPPQVGVLTARQQPVAFASELPGRVEAFRVAEVRARAAGIVQKRLFAEGSLVKEGQELFQIDPAPLRAALGNAAAALQKAEAALAAARSKEERYAPLVKTQAVSQQEFADIAAARKVAEAEVAAARAARETAQLNLSYASVTAPISGRIGRALVSEGALVGQGEPTPLAVIQQIDPIYVNLAQPSASFLRLRQLVASGTVEATEAQVTLVTEDGREHPQRGRLLFTDATVDPDTGTVHVRAQFPNPQRLLLPGMYVRARLAQAVGTAFLVPQQAVSRAGDKSSVMVVGADDKAAERTVRVEAARGTSWIVSDGLKDGDRVIVDGLQRVRPGAPVTPVPWNPPAAQ